MDMTLRDIQKVLDVKVDYSDRAAMENKMTDCLNVTGISAKLIAQTLGDLERAKGEVMRKYPDATYRLLKMRMDSETAQEQENYMLAQRLSVSLLKTIDGLKTLLAIQMGEGDEINFSKFR